MVVRIRFAHGPRVDPKRKTNQRLALACSSLLTPAALMACVLAVWRLAADMHWAGKFAISSGFFSHWQVWMVSAVSLQSCAHALNRYGRSGSAAIAGRRPR